MAKAAKKLTIEEARRPDPSCPLGLPPKRLPDGAPNREYYREAYSRITTHGLSCLASGQQPTVNIKQLADTLMDEAKLCDFTESEIIDRRTDAEVFKDETARLLNQPESVFEVTDRTLDHLEREIVKSLELTKDEIEALLDPLMTLPTEAVRALEDLGESPGKGWLNRILRVKRLRNLCRNPEPIRTKDPVDKAAWQASHVLRYMLYVARSNNALVKKDDDAVKRLIRFGKMHATMAVTLWTAEYGIEFRLDGIHWDAKRYDGALILAPPRHGKSEMAMNFASLWVNKRPLTQGVYLHAKEDSADEALGYVKSTYDLSSDRGRRNRALFPGMRLSSKGNQSKMQVVTASKTKNPTFVSAGVFTDRQGSNTDFQVRDDVVPQEDATEATTRERRIQKLSGTWDQRQRGDSAFTLIIGTPWHNADYLWKTVKRIKSGEINYAMCIIRCGGPLTTPKFYAAWPEVYDSAWLENEYRKMNNPKLWAATHMANPKSDETSIIARVRLYDRTSMQHQKFLENATYHLSIDPAATNREKNDKAAMLYAGVGIVSSVDHEAKEQVDVIKARVIDAKQMHNTPGELMESVAEYSQSRQVDHLHIEVKTGFVTVAEWMDSEFNVECVRHDPGDKSKEKRLRRCAMLIDERACKAAGHEAVIEFPGVPEIDRQGNPKVDSDGNIKIAPDPEYEWLIAQFTEFGVNPDDHALDAGTQLFNWLSERGFLPSAAGRVTTKIREAISERETKVERRIVDALRGANERQHRKHQGDDDMRSFWVEEREHAWN